MPKKNEDGFTLLEVMISIAILTMTLSVVYAMWFQSMRGIKAAEEKLHLLLIAQAKLEEISSAPVLKPVNATGSGPEGSWEATISSGPASTWLIKVTASHAGRKVELQTLRIR
jgi:prepilin-type N-terminal cleavage/methylation domain-containing protein